MGIDSYKLLLHGVDTLQCAYYLHQERKGDLDFAQLLQRREELRQLGNREGASIILGGIDFMLHPHGTGSGYPLLLTSEKFKIECGEFNEPSFFVTFPSQALWSKSAPLLHETFLKWACSVGFISHSPERLSRVDFCFDYDLPTVDFDADCFVSRTHKDSQHREHGKVQTFTLGHGGIILRVYDKVAEIEQQSDKVWFFLLWGQKESVWRIEWQLRKDILRQFRISTFEHLQKRQGDLLRYLCTEHTTLRLPNEDGNRSRWPIHPLWQDLQEQITQLDHLGISRIDGKIAALDERMLQYAISVYGYLKAFAAVYCVKNDFETIDSETALAHLRQRLLELHDSISWRCEVEKRIAAIESGAW